MTSVPVCHGECDARVHCQLQLQRLPAKILTHIVGGLEEGIVVSSVWLMHATLQFSGECREHRRIPCKIPTIATSYRGVPKTSPNIIRGLAPSVRSSVDISSFRNDPAGNSSDVQLIGKIALKPSGTFDIRSLLGTPYKTLRLSSTFGLKKISSLSSHPPSHRKAMSLEVPGARAPRVRGASSIVSDRDGYAFHHQ